MDKLKSSLKDVLCELLEDAEVQETIARIAKKDREREEEFLKKIEILEREKEILDRQLEEARTEREKLCENYRRLEQEKEEARTKHEKLCESYRNLKQEREKAQAEREKLSENNRRLKQEREEAWSERDRLSENNRRLEQEREEARKASQEAYRLYRVQKKEFEPLEEIKEIWQGISKLDKSQKSYLEILCGSWDVKSFIALGKDKNGIKQLWNFIRDEIMGSKRNEDNIRILAKYFDLCISVYNMTNIRKEFYEKVEVLIGREYDSRQCIKTSESIVNGVVKEVLLNGYCIQDDVMKPIVIVQ